MSGGLAAVAFDVGGVLCTSPVDEFAKVDAEYGLPLGTVASFIRGGGDTFAQCEVGRLPITAFYAACIDSIESTHHVRIPSARLDEMFDACMTDARPEMLALLSELKEAGYRVALLTNIYAERRSWLRRTFPSGLIDFYGDSSELGLRKPDPEIYRALVAGLGVPAGKVAFVDDFAENLEPARELGMTVVCYATSEQVRRDLVESGVRIPERLVTDR